MFPRSQHFDAQNGKRIKNSVDNPCDDENIDDKELQKLIKIDTDHWKQVLVRIIEVVKCMAKKNLLAFSGTTEISYEESSEKFLGLIKMIAEFDTVMQLHFWLVKDEKAHCHYLRHKVQNELIEMLAYNVKSEIIKKIKEVEEFFLGFLVVEYSSSLGLFNVLQNALKSLDLDINRVRGQGYGNGSSMKGKHQVVQKKLIDVNPRAFYMPCGCHSLNLVLCDMANSCFKARFFFGTCQTICDVFSNSSNSWDVLLKYIDESTLKSLSTTRCESDIESVKAIKTQIGQIKEALMQLAEVSDDAKVCRDVESLLNGELSSFEFIVSLVIWHEILDKINLVSKESQSKNMFLDVAVQNLERLVVYFEKYRENGFYCAISEAKEIADKIGVEHEFVAFSKKKQFDVIPNTKREQEFAQEIFRNDYFLVLVDMVLSQLRTRFEQMKEFESIFGFLFNGRKLAMLHDKDLKKCCMNLEVVLTNGDNSNIDGHSLFVELQVLQGILREQACERENPWTSLQIMEFAKKMDMFPYVMIAYRILLTIPVTVASPEHSFSKSKLLKMFLSCSMSQERLNHLAILSIESKYLAHVNYDEMIDILASKNAQRYRFR